MVAVGGDSGTGKTTIVSGLRRVFGDDQIATISLDDYHVLDRSARKRLGVTALDPIANDLVLMGQHMEALRRGETVDKPTYDHTTGTFGPRELVAPRRIVIVRGLFPLFTPRLRAAFDLRVWLDPQEELKWAWKVKRDCAQRGYSIPEVIRQIVERRDAQLAHIAPQKAHADLVVRFVAPAGYFLPGTAVEHDDSHLNVQIHLRAGLPRLDLDDVLDAGPAPAIRTSPGGSNTARRDGRPFLLEIDGTVTSAVARDLDERIWAHLESHRTLRPDDIGQYADGASERHSDPLALTQLLLAAQIVRAGLPADTGAGERIAQPSHPSSPIGARAASAASG